MSRPFLKEITAGEARDLSRQAKEVPPIILANIYSSIRAAANKGQDMITVYKNNSTYFPALKKTLESAGFRVTLVADQRDGDFIRIDW